MTRGLLGPHASRLAPLRVIAFAMLNARHCLELLGSCFKKDDATPVVVIPFTPHLIVAVHSFRHF